MTEAGPSTPRKRSGKKRGAAPGSSPKAKAARIDEPEQDVDVDVDGDGDAEIDDDGDAEEKQSSSEPMPVDPMAALEDAENADGPVEEAPQAESHVPGVAPVRADEFSTEASREVEAAKGLGGGEEGEGKMKLVHSVRHQVAIPPGYPYVPISEHKRHDPPARVYSFELDPFQFVATSCIERNESVLVAAHTSAGKTVVAEYAIAKCLKEGKRVVYTSPIKALSNQKYRDFIETFGAEEVGLMTGDVTINPTASCLVLTTEILRSMLYRGSEVIREVAWVIFDEVHYMRDKERGVVWEETIILLPHTIRHVFLSATIPNAMEFCEWVCQTHEQPCHVVYTDFRPTPLQHYLFPAGSEGIFLVVDEKSNFREDNFQKAMASLAASQGEDSADPNAGKGRKGGKTKKGGAIKGGVSDIYKIVKLIMNRNLNPVIIFAFSKRECEALALQMSKLDFNTEDEAATVQQVFENAMGQLAEDDRKLPQIQQLLPLLKRGIGIHHGGLLPILKEVIEILFQEGLLKALFATETFSIGLNMPAKTVVFTSVRKFDGKDFRNLSGGEYIQMSGRAGRRGLDARGIVIMMCDEKIEPDAAKGMVKGQSDRLDSAFHLGYNMIINLMRVEGVSPEFMLEHSFFQFQNSLSIPVLQKQLKAAEEYRDSIVIENEDDIAEYFDLRDQLKTLEGDFKSVITHPQYILPFLQPGRMVEIRDGDRDFGWAVVVAYNKIVPKRGAPVPGPNDPPQNGYVVDVLVRVASGSSIPRDRSSAGILPPRDGDKGEVAIIGVLLSTIQSITHLRLHLPKDLRTQADKNTAFRAVAEVKKRFPKGITLLDPVQNMGIKDDSFKKLVKKIAILENKIQSLPITSAPDLAEKYDEYDRKVQAIAAVRGLKKRISSVHDVLQLEELKGRKRVLRRLGFIDNDDVVQMKGRTACEISTGDELLLTELMFGGVFNPLTPEQAAALLSVFVFQEKSESKVNLKEDLAGPLRVLQETARRIAKVSNESKVPLVEDEYVQSFRVEMIPVVLEWCKGASFGDIAKLSDAFEGSIVRAFRRLTELIRQMGQAAHAIGNKELEDKFAKSIEILERPGSVMYNPSLYL